MSDVSRVRFKDRTLVDPIFRNPVDDYQLRARRRNLVIFIVIALVVVFIAVARGWLD
jgi:hypothetical protein